MTSSAIAGATASIRAIDAHAHVLQRDLPLVAQRHSAPKRDATVDELVGLLDRHGVSHALLTAPSFYGPDNRLLLSALARFPGRLRGTAIVEPEVAAEALDVMNAAGVVGVRFNWVRRESLPDVASAAYAALFAKVRALGWHVEIYLEGPKLAHVLPALRGSGVPVVVDHFGSPDPAAGVGCRGFRAVLEGVRAGDTYVKLSAPYRLGGADPQRYIDALVEAGPRQLVWASDWPFVGFEEAITYPQCVDALCTWIADEALRRTILVDTPARLFRFDAMGPTTLRNVQGDVHA